MRNLTLLLVLLILSLFSLSAQTKWYKATFVFLNKDEIVKEWDAVDFDISWEENILPGTNADAHLVKFHNDDNESYFLTKIDSEHSDGQEIESFFALDKNSQPLYFFFIKNPNGKLFIVLANDDIAVYFNIEEKKES